MFNTLSDISETKADTRKYTPAPELPLPVNKIGIEIEMEGLKDKGSLFALTSNGYWNIKDDSSLRGNAAELVSVPIFGEDIRTALEEVQAFFKAKKYKPAFNARTSLHVHMEMVDLSKEELIRLIVLYCAVEPVLFNYCDDTRQNNLYCLPISRIEEQKRRVARLIESLEASDRRAVQQHLQRWPKYCAINLNNITGIGTIEFRHMHGTVDTEEILTWIKLLMCIKKYAVHTMNGYNDFPEIVSGFDPREYLNSIFGELSVTIDGPMLGDQLLAGVRTAQDILLHRRLYKSTEIIASKQKPDMVSSLTRIFDTKPAPKTKSKKETLEALSHVHATFSAHPAGAVFTTTPSGEWFVDGDEYVDVAAPVPDQEPEF